MLTPETLSPPPDAAKAIPKPTMRFIYPLGGPARRDRAARAELR